MLLCDFYKISHREMYPKGTEYVYSTWTPRSSKIPHIREIVVFGHQRFVKKYLVDFFQDHFFNQRLEPILGNYKYVLKCSLGVENAPTDHIVKLHALGYMPLKVRSLPEGMIVPIGTPILTIENTNPEFFWLTNYIESLMSCELWSPCTSATIAHQFKKLCVAYAYVTTGLKWAECFELAEFQCHDFSMRGMSSLESAASTGMGHLLSFKGTDNIPAIRELDNYYRSYRGQSIPATEHSIQCSFQNDDLAYFDSIISDIHPSGFVSIVADGYDYWNVLQNILPQLRDKIMNRQGKVVIRPDSGDPIKIICGDPDSSIEIIRKGTVQYLFELFGGTTSKFGYKTLDSHIGAIYGDSITLPVATEILERLKNKGFASTNIVFGIGSFTYQYQTRDTFGFALKSTLVCVNGKWIPIYKDPKTGDGLKKSQKGAVCVYNDICDNNAIAWVDGKSIDESSDVNGLLRTIFNNGKVQNFEIGHQIEKRLGLNISELYI